MTSLYASVAIGTAATMMAIALLLLRLKFRGQRPVVKLMRQWVAMGNRTSGVVLALMSAVAVYSFAQIPARPASALIGASSPDTVVPSQQADGNESDTSAPTDQAAIDALRTYANTIDSNSPSTPTAPESAALPDVNTMIGKLVERLEKQPEDAQGWKMLGWSYLNTERPEDAEKAYATAFKIDPNDVEIQKGLETARAAKAMTTGTALQDGAGPPAMGGTTAVEGQLDTQRDNMIRGMVDRLAARLEASPIDEDGWLRLMRSRMTLGEKDAAKAALAKALEAFASDSAAKARLTAAARDLGVESN